MLTSHQVRSQIIEALQLDLVGPRTGHPAHARYAQEVLRIAPSKWYLTGFLVPYEAPHHQRTDADSDDSLETAACKPGTDDDVSPEAASARKAFFPSSLGLSVLPLTPQIARQLGVPDNTQGVVVNGQEHRQSLLVPWRGDIVPWAVDSFEALEEASFEALAALAAGVAGHDAAGSRRDHSSGRWCACQPWTSLARVSGSSNISAAPRI